MNLFNLNYKTIVLTGASGIIGSKVCEGLLSCGAQVALLDINLKNLEILANDLSKKYSKDKILPLECDVSNKKSVSDSVSKVISKWKQIDVLHNNAASKSDDLEKFFAPFEDYSLDEWRKIMSVNIDGMMLMAQAVGKEMVRTNSGGSIIQTASIYGITAPDQRIYEGSEYLGRQINTPAVYAASKGAVVALTKYLATYWANKKIRVNTITPGGVESGQNDTFKQKYSARVPLGRMAKADEMVGAVIYLASDASSYVTGQNIIVDGGLTAW